MADQAAARRAQCDAHGDFAFAGGRACEQKIGHVAACDQQQQQQNGSKQRIECVLKTADQAIQQRLGFNSKSFRKCSARVCLLQAVRNRVEFGPGSLHADARFETPDEIASSLVRPHGHPKARTKGVESRGHDPDKGPWSTAQDKTSPKNLRIAAEFSLPKPVVHYKYGRSIGAAVLLRDRAAQQRQHAQIVKRVRRYARAARQDARGFAIVIEEAAQALVSNHVIEHMILLTKSTEF